MQMKRNKTAGKIVRVWMILRSNNSICYSASTSADLDRQKKLKTFPWGKCRPFIDIDKINDSAGFKIYCELNIFLF